MFFLLIIITEFVYLLVIACKEVDLYDNGKQVTYAQIDHYVRVRSNFYESFEIKDV